MSPTKNPLMNDLMSVFLQDVELKEGDGLAVLLDPLLALVLADLVTIKSGLGDLLESETLCSHALDRVDVVFAQVGLAERLLVTSLEDGAQELLTVLHQLLELAKHHDVIRQSAIRHLGGFAIGSDHRFEDGELIVDRQSRKGLFGCTFGHGTLL